MTLFTYYLRYGNPLQVLLELLTISSKVSVCNIHSSLILNRYQSFQALIS